MQSPSHNTDSKKRKSIEHIESPIKNIKPDSTALPAFQKTMQTLFTEDTSFAKDTLTYCILHSLNTEKGTPSLIPLLLFTLDNTSVTIAGHTLSLASALSEKEFIEAIMSNRYLNKNMEAIEHESKKMFNKINILQNQCLSLHSKIQTHKQATQFTTCEMTPIIPTTRENNGTEITLVDLIISARSYLRNLDTAKTREYNLAQFCDHENILPSHLTDAEKLHSSPLLLAKILLAETDGDFTSNILFSMYNERFNTAPIDLTTPAFPHTYYELFFTGLTPNLSTVATLMFLKQHLLPAITQKIPQTLVRLSRQFVHKLIPQLSDSQNDSLVLKACRIYIIGKEGSDTSSNYNQFKSIVEKIDDKLILVLNKLQADSAVTEKTGFGSREKIINKQALSTPIPFIIRTESREKQNVDFFHALKTKKDIKEEDTNNLKSEWKKFLSKLFAAENAVLPEQVSTILSHGIFTSTLEKHLAAIYSTLEDELNVLTAESNSLSLMPTLVEHELMKKTLALVQIQQKEDNTKSSELTRKNIELSNIIKERDLEIATLKETLASLEPQLAEVTERNQNLESYLIQLPSDVTSEDLFADLEEYFNIIPTASMESTDSLSPKI